jgi:very-short-patch-repair endonuclease
MTEAEVMLWSRLRLRQMHGISFRRQHPIGPYIADFAHVPSKLVIEIDGVTMQGMRSMNMTWCATVT